MSDFITFEPAQHTIASSLQAGKRSRLFAPSILLDSRNFPAAATRERIKQMPPVSPFKSYEASERGDRRVRLGKQYEIVQAAERQHRVGKWELLERVKEILPKSRTAKCMNHAPGSAGVSVQVHVDQYGNDVGAHYDSVFTCGSVWTCPVCSSRIQHRRHEELKTGIDYWQGLGGQVVMLTLTIPHYSHEKLHEVKERFQKARRIFRNRKAWKSWSGQHGLLGSVRTLEVTVGKNGWHVHTHELLFFDKYNSEYHRQYKAYLLDAWQAACLSAGLGCPNEHGVELTDFHDSKNAADYMLKFGPYEMTSTHTKRGTSDNKSPWDLIRSGTGQDAALFREFAENFHGSRQLVYSAGLRTVLKMDAEEENERLAAQAVIEPETVDIIEVYIIEKDDWKIVKKTRSRGILLEIARESGERGVGSFLERLRNEKKQQQNWTKKPYGPWKFKGSTA